jgi:uncharacterized protein (TIGR02996 family)
MNADAFLHAIAETPEDDTPRLVYADWLEENGNVERAEFIRVQIELARVGMDDPRYPELRRREAELLEDHQAAWGRAELPAGMEVEDYEEGYWPRSGFRRGLPARVKSNLSAFLAGGERLARLPVERLHVADYGRTAYRPENVARRVERLARCPALAGFPRLDLQYNGGIRPSGLAALFSSPHLPLLRELILGPDSLGEHGARLLAGCERLNRLRRLDLSSCRITTGGLRVLLASPHLHALEEVDLHGNNLDDEAARILARHESARSWQALNIGYNGMGLPGVRALLESPHWVGLEVLDLTSLMIGAGTWLGDPLVGELVRVGLPGSVRRLDLGTSRLTGAGVALLARDERLAKLAELNLCLNRMGSEGARALAGSPHLAGLKTLTLFGAELDDDATLALAASPHLRPHRVHLAHNAIGPAGARALAESDFLERVVELNLSHNPLGDDGLRALAGASWLPRLCELDLARTEIGNAGLAALADSPALAGIVRLDLVANRIGEKGALALARSPHAARLRRLDLARNRIGKAALKALRERFGNRLVSHRSTP